MPSMMGSMGSMGGGSGGGMGMPLGQAKGGNAGDTMPTENVMGMDIPDFMGAMYAGNQTEIHDNPYGTVPAGIKSQAGGSIAPIGSNSSNSTGLSNALAGALSNQSFASNANGPANPNNPIPMTQYTGAIGPQNGTSQPLPADTISGPVAMYNGPIGPQNGTADPMGQLLQKQYINQQ